MAPWTRNYPVNYGLKVAFITVACIFLLTIPLSIKSEDSNSNTESSDHELEQRKMVLGSRPPGCNNKCLNCRPCIATLVIPPSHHKKKLSTHLSTTYISHVDEDGSYYLLSWKCKCGNKLFQP